VEFTKTTLPGVFLIAPSRSTDDRGAFVKYFDGAAFGGLGLCSTFTQFALARNRSMGTLRGMHYQVPPAAECKIVRCTQGRIYDVLVDVRKDSPSFGRWEGFTLDASDRALYVPEGVAHGYQTLADDSVVEYLISAEYVEALQRGIHYSSKTLAIGWPLAVACVSPRDDAFPEFGNAG
jgi:dTDP-4-dehydrorhamnose 3,5-epimerase